jgi:GDPmannose 4,6-dehydratase
MDKALITGVTGQDGSYLAELLISKGYEVHGTVRRASSPNTSRVDHLIGKGLTLHQADLTDQISISKVVHEVEPMEIYNLGAQSFVATSWDQAELTMQVTGLGAMRVFEAARSMPLDLRPRVYQASSSEMFGEVVETPQSERTPFNPSSPYGVAKCMAHHAAKVWRKSYGLPISCGILFNHESPRRGLEFVTRKITNHVARQAKGLTKEPLELGNLDAVRDWGFAGDYVEAMYRMLQQDQPGDYVVATGETHTVRQFVEAAYRDINIDGITWVGSGTSEEGWVLGRVRIKVNPKFYRPNDVVYLKGDPTKAWNELAWQPETSFERLVRMMVAADLGSI